MSKQKVKDPELKNGEKVKRYSLETEEREKMQNTQSVLGILSMQKEGLNYSIMLQLSMIRKRLNINEESPEGYDRIIDFDPEKYDLLVIDVPKPKEPVNNEMPVDEAENQETAKN